MRNGGIYTRWRCLSGCCRLMAQKFRIEGLKELDKALGQLQRATGKNVLRRVARNALEPIIEVAKGLVHAPTGKLRDSLAVSTKLSHHQKTLHKRMFASEKSSVEMFAGAGPHHFVPQAIMEEFGTVKQGAHPFLRPAWDGGKMRMLNGIKRDLWAEIKRAAARVARKKARALKKAGR